MSEIWTAISTRVGEQGGWIVGGLILLFGVCGTLCTRFIYDRFLKPYTSPRPKPAEEIKDKKSPEDEQPTLHLLYEELWNFCTGDGGHGYYPGLPLLALVLRNGSKKIVVKDVSIKLTGRRGGSTELALHGMLVGGPMEPFQQEVFRFLTWETVARDLIKDGAQAEVKTGTGTLTLSPTEFAKELLILVERQKLKRPAMFHPELAKNFLA